MNPPRRQEWKHVLESRPQRPNVVVYLTDQQRWDFTNFAGNPLDSMPNFERIAQENTWLPTAFTCQPVCGSAPSSLRMILYATETGYYRNGSPLLQNLPTLAHHFRDAGYQTGYIGKWHLADSNPVPEEQRGGYEKWLASNTLEFTSEAYQTQLFDNNDDAVISPDTASMRSPTPRSGSWTTRRTIPSSCSSPISSHTIRIGSIPNISRSPATWAW